MMELRWNAARIGIRPHCSNRTLAVLFYATLLWLGPAVLCSSQTPLQTASSPGQLSVEETAFRELTIAVAADLDSPVHTQAAAVISDLAITSERFNAPIREAIKIADVEPYDESRLSAAIVIMPASTIPRQEQIALLLDTLVFLSSRETSLGRQLKAGFLKDGPRASVLVNQIVANLATDPEGLAGVLENRFKQGQQPAVIYSLLPLSNSHGARLLPYVVQAGLDEDRFVRSSVFIALRKTFTNAETASIDLMKQRFKSDADQIFNLNDIDQNRMLTPNEWSTMLVNPVAADVDGDSKVSADEFIDWFARRKISLLRNAP